MNNIKNDINLREAVGRRERQLPPMPSDLNERVMKVLPLASPDSLPLTPSEGRGTQSRFSSLSLWGLIAACIVVAFLLAVPQIKERRELARYEGSYTVVDGQRIDDLGRIKADINEALAMAQMAEANVPADDIASEAASAILQAAKDPEMRAVVERMLH
jgi:hypothetical protein